MCVNAHMCVLVCVGVFVCERRVRAFDLSVCLLVRLLLTYSKISAISSFTFPVSEVGGSINPFTAPPSGKCITILMQKA